MARKPNPHFFTREHGQAVVRLRFTPEEASLMEEAAGKTPVVQWIYTTLKESAAQQAEQARKQRRKAPPPQ